MSKKKAQRTDESTDDGKHAQGQGSAVGRSEVLVSIKKKEDDAAKLLEAERLAGEKRIEEAKAQAAELIEDAKKAAEDLLDKSSSRAMKEAKAKGDAILKSAQSDAKNVKKVNKDEALSVFESVTKKKFNIGAE